MKRTLTMLLLLPALLAAQAHDFYIAPAGNDENPGTRERPFASLKRAKQAVRKLKQTKPGDISVGIAGGLYSLRETTVFSLDDSGSGRQRITYEALPNAVPVFSSARPVENWSKVAELPEGFPAQAQGRVWAAPLPDGISLPKYLFQSGKPLPRAITPGFVPAKRYESWDGEPMDRKTVHIPPGIGIGWQDLKDMELLILPTCDWTMYNFPLESVDTKKNIVTTAISGKYALGAQQKRSWTLTTAWFGNCREGMLEPGNWYASTKDGKLYFFSDTKHPPKGITVPTLKEYIRVEGTADNKTPADQMVMNLHFNGLVFTQGDRHTWPKSHTGCNMQHEWEAYDTGNALVRFRGAKGCSITGCRFAYSGGAGIRLDLSCQENRIEGNCLWRLGGSGIVLGGYGVGYKDVNFGNQIVNNHIHHIGEAYWHSSAIIVFQSGKNRIAHNLIHHTPYSGLTVTGPRDLSRNCPESGRTHLVDVDRKMDYWAFRFKVLHSRENVVEYNEFHHTVEVMGDGNPIYISGCGKGNIYRYNYLHDNAGKHASTAIRTDGVTQHQYFFGNIVINSPKGAFTLKDKGHRVENNFMVDCGTYIRLSGGPNDDTVIRNNVMLHTAGSTPSFLRIQQAPWLKKITVDTVEFSGNRCYAQGLKAEAGQALIANMKKQGFSGIVYAKLASLRVQDGKPLLNKAAPIFQQGYSFVDISKAGLDPAFPQNWRQYDETIPAQAHFKQVPR